MVISELWSFVNSALSAAIGKTISVAITEVSYWNVPTNDFPTGR